MSKKEAVRQFQKMLKSFTIGSICHLLAEANRKKIGNAGGADNQVASGKCDIADHVLFCVGVGLDAALPE